MKMTPYGNALTPTVENDISTIYGAAETVIGADINETAGYYCANFHSYLLFLLQSWISKSTEYDPQAIKLQDIELPLIAWPSGSIYWIVSEKTSLFSSQRSRDDRPVFWSSCNRHGKGFRIVSLTSTGGVVAYTTQQDDRLILSRFISRTANGATRRWNR